MRVRTRRTALVDHPESRAPFLSLPACDLSCLYNFFPEKSWSIKEKFLCIPKIRDLKDLVELKRFGRGWAPHLLYVSWGEGLRGATSATQPSIPGQPSPSFQKYSWGIHTTKHLLMPGNKYSGAGKREEVVEKPRITGRLAGDFKDSSTHRFCWFWFDALSVRGVPSCHFKLKRQQHLKSSKNKEKLRKISCFLYPGKLFRKGKRDYLGTWSWRVPRQCPVFSWGALQEHWGPVQCLQPCCPVPAALCPVPSRSGRQMGTEGTGRILGAGTSADPS